MKVCVKCNIEKNITEYSKQKKGKFGVTSVCKKCCSLIGKEYYEKNKQKIKTKQKDNQEKYRINNREKAKIRAKEWRKNNPGYSSEESRLKHNLRRRLKDALNRKSFKNNGRINYELILLKLGKKPDDGKVYHVDHIIPLSCFDLTKDEHVILAQQPENLRWLSEEENLKKRDKVDMEMIEKHGCLWIYNKLKEG